MNEQVFGICIANQTPHTQAECPYPVSLNWRVVPAPAPPRPSADQNLIDSLPEYGR